MEILKSVLFLLTNLMAFNLARASGDGDLPEKTTENTPYSTFPYSTIFSNKNNGEEVDRSHGISPINFIANYGEDIREVIIKARAVYWIPTSCDSLAERGYTCYGCSESLHCMANNFALKAICGGRRPFCFNGVCSDLRGDKCNKVLDSNSAQASAVVQNEHVVEALPNAINSTLS